MKRYLLILLALMGLLEFAYGQDEIPFLGRDMNIETLYREDSLGWWFIPQADTSKLVFIGKDRNTYKLMDKKSQRLIVVGELGGRIYTDFYMRFGKWTEYYDNGNTKCIGFYYKDQPIGLWQFYYSNRQLKDTYSYSLIEADSSSSYCLVGSYQSFFENGQLKVNGFYKATTDTATIERVTPEPPYDNKVVVVRQPVSKKFGIWTYYKQNGELEKKEEFRER